MDIRPFSDFELLPAYIRVAEDLRSQFGKPGYEYGQFLPSEHVLSESYRLSRGTIRKALNILAEDGLISRQPGRGTLIVPPAPKNIEKRTDIAVVWSIMEWVNFNTLSIIERHLSGVGCNILFSTTQHNPALERETLDRFKHTKPDGLILYSTGSSKNDDLLIELSEMGIPIVLLGSFTQKSAEKLSWVASENINSSYQLVRHLIELKHKRIAYVSLSSVDTVAQDALERRKGYEHAISDAGLQPMVLIEDKVNLQNYDKIIFADKLFDFIEIYQPTAIFFKNDATAYRFAQYFYDWGIRIPDDMSIVGFDGLKMEFGFAPFELTTVQQDFGLIGKETADILLRLMDNPAQRPMQVRVPVSLHIGNTTATPKQKT